MWETLKERAFLPACVRACSACVRVAWRLSCKGPLEQSNQRRRHVNWRASNSHTLFTEPTRRTSLGVVGRKATGTKEFSEAGGVRQQRELHSKLLCLSQLSPVHATTRKIPRLCYLGRRCGRLTGCFDAVASSRPHVASLGWASFPWASRLGHCQQKEGPEAWRPRTPTHLPSARSTAQTQKRGVGRLIKGCSQQWALRLNGSGPEPPSF